MGFKINLFAKRAKANSNKSDVIGYYGISKKRCEAPLYGELSHYIKNNNACSTTYAPYCTAYEKMLRECAVKNTYFSDKDSFWTNTKAPELTESLIDTFYTARIGSPEWECAIYEITAMCSIFYREIINFKSDFLEVKMMERKFLQIRKDSVNSFKNNGWVEYKWGKINFLKFIAWAVTHSFVLDCLVPDKKMVKIMEYVQTCSESTIKNWNEYVQSQQDIAPAIKDLFYVPKMMGQKCGYLAFMERVNENTPSRAEMEHPEEESEADRTVA